ncbi:hypothetical protein ACA910_011034 [Epithemia clementina (nom. ined.)]
MAIRYRTSYHGAISGAEARSGAGGARAGILLMQSSSHLSYTKSLGYTKSLELHASSRLCDKETRRENCIDMAKEACLARNSLTTFGATTPSQSRSLSRSESTSKDKDRDFLSGSQQGEEPGEIVRNETKRESHAAAASTDETQLHHHFFSWSEFRRMGYRRDRSSKKRDRKWNLQSQQQEQVESTEKNQANDWNRKVNVVKESKSITSARCKYSDFAPTLRARFYDFSPIEPFSSAGSLHFQTAASARRLGRGLSFNQTALRNGARKQLFSGDQETHSKATALPSESRQSFSSASQRNEPLDLPDAKMPHYIIGGSKTSSFRQRSFAKIKIALFSSNSKASEAFNDPTNRSTRMWFER